MTDAPKAADASTADETPMQRALRLRQAQLAARSRPGENTPSARANAAAPVGANKPWMKK
jgi:hypothetical protein